MTFATDLESDITPLLDAPADAHLDVTVPGSPEERARFAMLQHRLTSPTSCKCS